MDEALLREQEVSSLYRLSVPWLRRARVRGDGPGYLKIGQRMVRYRRSDVEQFLNGRRVATGTRRYAT